MKTRISLALDFCKVPTMLFDNRMVNWPMTIEEEIARLGTLDHAGSVLLQFARSLFPGEFKKKSGAWIYYPNFVGFEVRHARAQKINILFRRIDVSPDERRILPISKGPLTYRRSEISGIRQIPTALAYIERSWRDWHRETLYKEPQL